MAFPWSALDAGISQGLLYAPAALGFAVSLRMMRFPDLTVEASFMLGSATFAVLRTSGFSIPSCCAAAMVVGALAGATTGFLHAMLGINRFLAGILVVAGSYTVGLRVMHGSNISLIGTVEPFAFASPVDRFGPAGTHLGAIACSLVLALLLTALTILVLGGRFGTGLRAAGDNAPFALALGLPVKGNIILGLALTNSLAGLSGALVSGSQGFSDVSLGQGVLVMVLAALAIGERLAHTSRYAQRVVVPVASLIGIVLYETVVSLAVWVGLPATDLRLATAVFVLVVLALRPVKGDMLFQERI